MSDSSPLDGASPGLALALVLRFLLELALLAGAGVAVHRLAPEGWKWPAAIAAVVVIGALWALFLSPKAAIAIPAVAQVLLEAVLFAGAGAALWAAGFGVMGGLLVGVWALDRLAMALLATN